jgi:hypothetical protein
VAEEGISIRDIGEVIAKGLRLPIAAVSAEWANEHLGELGGRFFGTNVLKACVITLGLH